MIIYQQFSDDEKFFFGVFEDLICIFVGIEYFDDIIVDFEQFFKVLVEKNSEQFKEVVEIKVGDVFVVLQVGVWK